MFWSVECVLNVFERCTLSDAIADLDLSSFSYDTVILSPNPHIEHMPHPLLPLVFAYQSDSDSLVPMLRIQCMEDDGKFTSSMRFSASQVANCSMSASHCFLSLCFV